MSNIVSDNSNNRFFKVQEELKRILSIFNGNNYTVEDNEIALPEELRDSLQTLDEKAKQYEVNGMLSDSIKQKSVAKKAKAEKPRTKKLSKEQISTVEKLSNKAINSKEDKDYELGDDR